MTTSWRTGRAAPSSHVRQDGEEQEAQPWPHGQTEALTTCVLPNGPPLPPCWLAARAAAPCFDGPRIVTHEVEDRPCYERPYLILDVRSPQEFQQCHILQGRPPHGQTDQLPRLSRQLSGLGPLFYLICLAVWRLSAWLCSAELPPPVPEPGQDLGRPAAICTYGRAAVSR